MLQRYRFTLESTHDRNVVTELLAFILAIIGTFIVTGILLRIADIDPVHAYLSLFSGAVGSKEAILETLVRATPLTFTAIATVLAFKGKIWTIGQEGQLVGGAMMSYWSLLLFGDLPRPILLIVVITFGFLGGALLGLISGVLRAYFRVNEIISTVLLNYIISLVLSALLYDQKLWMDPSYYYPQSAPVPDVARFPVLIPESPLHFGIILALLAVVLVYWLLKKTPYGYDIRAIGANPVASLFHGVHLNNIIIITLVLSGGIAGLAGAGEVFGVHHRLVTDISGNYGYTGIAVAMIADLNPIAVIPTAVLFGGLMNGSFSLLVDTNVPTTFIYALQAIFLLFLLVARVFSTYRIKRNSNDR